jgi:hypothetical protein
MELSTTIAVYDSCSSEEVNRFIAAGWILHDIVHTVCDYSVFKDEEVHYILLWDQKIDPAYPSLTFAVIG